MAMEEVTGLVVWDDALEWTTLRKVRDHLEGIGSGRVELGPETEAAPAEEKDGAATERAEAAGERIRAECSSLKGDVTVGLSSEGVLLRVETLPTVDRDELNSMVQRKVEVFSPFPVESMVVSHEVLEKKDDTCLVLIAAVKEEVVESLGKTLRPAGIFPARVDAVVLGWWRLLRDADEIERKGRQLVLLIEGNVPEMIVMEDGIPIVFRSLGKTEGLDEEEFVNETAREIGHTLMSLELEYGSAEACSVSVRYRTKPPGTLVEKLRSECSCEIRAESLQSLPSVSEGLARRSIAGNGPELDLTPTAWRVMSRSRLFRKRMLAVAGALAGVWVLGMGGLAGGLFCQNRQLASLKAEQKKWQEPAMEVRNMRRRVFMINRYTDTTDSALECLREISLLQPGGIDLTSFSYRKGETVKIAGEAGTVDVIYTFKKNLDGSKLFFEASLQGPRHDKRKRKEVFDIEMRLPRGDR